jgi:outer membrane protein assembly factor BamB
MKVFKRRVLSVFLCITSIALFAQIVGCGEKSETVKEPKDSKGDGKVAELSSDCDWPMFGRTPEGNRIAPDGCGPKTDNLGLKWEFKIPGDENYTDNYVVSGKNVYMTTKSGKVYCLDDSDLSLKWEFNTNSQVRTSLIVDTDRLYIATEDKHFYCIDTKNGKKLWDIGQGAQLFSVDDEYIRNIDIDGSYLYIQTSMYSIFCFDKTNGNKIWVKVIENGFLSEIKIINEKIYFWGSNFICLNAKNGEKIWELNEGKTYAGEFKSNGCYYDGGPPGERLPFFFDDKIIMDRTLLQKGLYLNGNTGEIIWKFESIGWTHSTLIGNKLIVESTYCLDKQENRKTRINCLDLESGIQTWEEDYNGEVIINTIDNESVILSNIENAYGGMGKTFCKLIELSTGNVIWNINIGFLSGTNINKETKKLYLWQGTLLQCINLVDGSKVWEKNYKNILAGNSSSTLEISAITNNKLMYSFYSPVKTICMDYEGNVVWEFDASSKWNYNYSPLTIFNNNIILGKDRKIFYVNIDSGKQIWIKKPYEYYSSYLATSSGMLYAAFDKLYCLEIESGKKVWEYSEPNEFFIHSTAISNGKLYAVSDNKKLYCLDAATGEKIWILNTEYEINASPIISNGKLYIVTSETKNEKTTSKIICIDSVTSANLWESVFDNTIIYSPAISNDKVVVATSNSSIACLDNLNGKKIWEFKTDKYIAVKPSIFDEKVFFGKDKTVITLNISDGKKIFEHTSKWYIATVILFEKDKIYFYTSDQIVHCLDISTGKSVWNAEKIIWIDEDIETINPAISNERYFIVGGHRIFSINKTNGSLVWEFEKERGADYRASMFLQYTVLLNGKLLLSSPEGKIYCFGDS